MIVGKAPEGEEGVCNYTSQCQRSKEKEQDGSKSGNIFKISRLTAWEETQVTSHLDKHNFGVNNPVGGVGKRMWESTRSTLSFSSAHILETVDLMVPNTLWWNSL